MRLRSPDVELECFGGDCGHSGYVCQNGKVLVREEFVEELKHLQLLCSVGVNLEDEYFAPFVRGYFPETDRNSEHDCGDAAPPA